MHVNQTLTAPSRVLALAGILAVAAALAGYVVGGPNGSRDLPTTDSVDAGFLRDMQAHHAQAVEMSTLVREATADDEVRTMALDIALTQQQQIGQMYALLRSWGLSQTSPGATMTWMEGSGAMADHSMRDMPTSASDMPGMASEEELEELARSRGGIAERLFLQLMIPHHEAGVVMAESAARDAGSAQVRGLAQSMVEAQSAEITAMRDMLDARGGPIP